VVILVQIAGVVLRFRFGNPEGDYNKEFNGWNLGLGRSPKWEKCPITRYGAAFCARTRSFGR
jgi:hypothetical protein